MKQHGQKQRGEECNSHILSHRSYVYVWVYVYIYMFIHTFIYTYTYIFTHTHTHSIVCVCVFGSHFSNCLVLFLGCVLRLAGLWGVSQFCRSAETHSIQLFTWFWVIRLSCLLGHSGFYFWANVTFDYKIALQDMILPSEASMVVRYLRLVPLVTFCFLLFWTCVMFLDIKS